MTTTTDGPAPRLPDPQRSRAVLVGPSAYENLAPLPAVPNNVARLTELLTDPRVWGLPPAHCVAVTEAATTDEVEEALLAAAREAGDTLLFYFAGHGLLDLDSGRLFLALGKAEDGPIVRAIDYDRIRRAVRESRCPSKVVVLDCCYGGHATMGDFAAQTVVEGTYLLTACGELSLAVAPPGEEFTAFTGALVRLLADGIPGGPELLSTEDVYWRLREELRGAGRPLPVQRAGNRGHRIVLARNRAVECARAAPGRAYRRERTEWLAPVAVRDRVAGLRDDGDGPAADALLDATGAGRAPQEVLGIVDELDPVDAERVLEAAARRSAAEVAELVGILVRLDRRDVLARTRRAMAGLPPAGVVAVAARIEPTERDALLDAAIDARFGRPDALIALVAAASTALPTAPGPDGAVDALLLRTAARIPPADAAALGDVLRDAGREAAAFRVYEAAVEILAERPAADVLALAVAMHESGRDGQARRLVGRAVAGRRDAPGHLALLTAAAETDLPYAVPDVVAGAAATLDADALVGLAGDLWRAGLDGPAGDLLATAAAERPVAGTIAALRALDEAGRPLDIRRVVEAAARRGPEEIAELVAYLGESGVESVAVLAEAVLAEGPEKTGQLMARLDRAGRREPVGRLVERLAATEASRIVAVMLELVRSGDRELGRRVAAAGTGSLAGTIALPGGTDPADRARLLVDLLASGARGVRLAGLEPDPAGFAGHLLAEPPAIIAAAVARADAGTGARKHVDAVLDGLAAGPGDPVTWIGRLEPAGRSLTDRYLGWFAYRNSPERIARLLIDLRGRGPARRLIRLLRVEARDRARRPEIAVRLAESPPALAAWEHWTSDPAELARGAAVDELHRRLGNGVLPGSVYGDPDTQWSQDLSLAPGERPLWLMTLPAGLLYSAVVGFSDREVHVATGRSKDPTDARDFRIGYQHLAGLRFRVWGTGIQLRERAGMTYHWAVDPRIIGRRPVNELVTLLNEVAVAVRAALDGLYRTDGAAPQG